MLALAVATVNESVLLLNGTVGLSKLTLGLWNLGKFAPNPLYGKVDVLPS